MSVSETIGKLLLEGYKMLAESCDICCTVLMQDRRGRIICVKCESNSMANAGAGDVIATTVKLSNGGSTLNTSNARSENTSASRGIQNGSTGGSTIATCEDMLLEEIENTTSSLKLMRQHQQDIQGKLIHIKYIRECAETIKALQALKGA